jgi:hypothetical protein
MALLGWKAFGTLCGKVLAEASSLPETLNYTTMAIAVCASCAALVALSNRTRPAVRDVAVNVQPEVVALKLMAAQTSFAESRLRLLAVAEQLEAKL